LRDELARVQPRRADAARRGARRVRVATGRCSRGGCCTPARAASAAL
jgi:hypothetical protein